MIVLTAACIAAIVTLGAIPRRLQRAATLIQVGQQSYWASIRSIPQRIPGTRWARAAARHRSTRVIDAVAALVAELQVGVPSRVALARAFTDIADICPRTVAAARFGGDVGEALATDGARLPPLVALGAVWRVGEESGTGLAKACSALLHGLRESEELRRILDAQLAGPRASARMLSLLPIVGVLMGLMLGGNPLAWLLTTLPGRLCLIAGIALNIAGVLWTRRIATHAMATA